MPKPAETSSVATAAATEAYAGEAPVDDPQKTQTDRKGRNET
jgi:hypothetical protein